MSDEPIDLREMADEEAEALKVQTVRDMLAQIDAQYPELVNTQRPDRISFTIGDAEAIRFLLGYIDRWMVAPPNGPEPTPEEMAAAASEMITTEGRMRRYVKALESIYRSECSCLGQMGTVDGVFQRIPCVHQAAGKALGK